MSRAKTFIRIALARARVAALVIATGLPFTIGCGSGDNVFKLADTTPPHAVSDLALAVGSDGTITATWTAPRDDGRVARVAGYQVRFGYGHTLDWNNALELDNPPVPAPPGVGELVVIPATERGRDLVVGVRAVDASGNVGPAGQLASVRISGVTLTGRCTDVMTGLGVAGMRVVVVAQKTVETVTDSDGHYVVDDIATGNVGILLESTSPVPYHRTQLQREVSDDTDLTTQVIPYLPTDESTASNVLELFDRLVNEWIDGSHRRWLAYPVRVFAPDFVNSLGVDYGSLARQAALQWNARAGVEIYQVVDEPPSDGVVFRFRTRAEMGIQNGLADTERDENGYYRSADIQVVDDFADAHRTYQVMLHELGHAIRFEHVSQTAYIMYPGQPLPDDISDDEAWAARLYVNLANDTPLDIYDRSSPLE